MSDRAMIDPEKFALGFANSNLAAGAEPSEVVAEAKKYLLSYLTAYYLVADFNGIESQNFNSPEEKPFKDLTFDELIDRVSQLNKY
ncbi:hypothetical protein [Secundilactobacillus kimchicus]|uniref:Uncharacterized protein n=1 Tax=Secundilactobacillus kimchicus JCM 15530 TaxID=1302272 RepID=A0A0R1HL33_9LACO|nr:hypothetical protein [Secundilactobacillus kimchicus]KRK47421.1 hypothetical protein FC96_GL002540 [Secundilactobacillus kimchicus JCM 15530]MBT9672318.1 hypothetical protein [Secundilactobacillus kimchicus]